MRGSEPTRREHINGLLHPAAKLLREKEAATPDAARIVLEGFVEMADENLSVRIRGVAQHMMEILVENVIGLLAGQHSMGLLMGLPLQHGCERDTGQRHG